MKIVLFLVDCRQQRRARLRYCDVGSHDFAVSMDTGP